MAGQPNLNPWITFDVTGLHVTEMGATPPVLTPHTIIPRGTAFRVSTDFTFGGALAAWLTALGLTWEAKFYCESIGPGPEVDLGSVSGATVAGTLAYGAPDTDCPVAAGIADPGTYKLTCIVKIGGVAGPSPITGFIEGPMIQIT